MDTAAAASCSLLVSKQQISVLAVLAGIHSLPTCLENQTSQVSEEPRVWQAGAYRRLTLATLYCVATLVDPDGDQ